MQPKPTPPPAPWERQPYDTPKSWTAFVTYRDLGDSRTLAKAAEQLGRHRQTVADWSRLHRWQNRVAAWDAEQDRIKREAQMKEVQAMAVRQARDLVALQRAGMAPATALLTRMSKLKQGETLYDAVDEDGKLRISNEDLTQLTLAAMRTLPAAMQAERLARGEPTEIVEQTGVVGHVHAGAVGIDLQAVIDALGQAGVVIGVTEADDDVDPADEPAVTMIELPAPAE